ncbi:flagellar biosynthetic protein FliO, partial [Cellulomonas olei]
MDSVVLGLRVLLALACVIGLIWVLARRAGWGARRRPAGPAVEVVGRQALGRHAGVAVVAVGNRRLLLGYGEQNVTMLTELAPAPAEAPASPATTAPTAADRAPVTLGSLAAAVLPTPRRARAARPSATSPAVPAS